jgi:tetratricopeptide (TPR) repeat protein
MLRLVLLFLVLTALLPAAPVEELLREAQVAEAKLDLARALELYQQADAARPNDAFILQKIARQYSDQVPDQPTDEGKREFATRGLEYARRSFALEPTNSAYAVSIAICHGHLALISDIRTKVQYSRLIKEEVERALALDPNNAWAHHLLGRWHYEVASLGATARFFARLFYGGIPPASTTEGVNHLKRATDLEPGELSHWIDLGFAYAAAGRIADARAAWAHGLAMPSRSPHDVPAKKRAADALKDLE